MRTHLTGGPAFPAHAQCGDETGMTLRDYFAAQAMAAYVSSDAWREDMGGTATARSAYAMADYMILERSK